MVSILLLVTLSRLFGWMARIKFSYIYTRLFWYICCYTFQFGNAGTCAFDEDNQNHKEEALEWTKFWYDQWFDSIEHWDGCCNPYNVGVLTICMEGQHIDWSLIDWEIARHY